MTYFVTNFNFYWVGKKEKFSCAKWRTNLLLTDSPYELKAFLESRERIKAKNISLESLFKSAGQVKYSFPFVRRLVPCVKVENAVPSVLLEISWNSKQCGHLVDEKFRIEFSKSSNDVNFSSIFNRMERPWSLVRKVKKMKYIPFSFVFSGIWAPGFEYGLLRKWHVVLPGTPEHYGTLRAHRRIFHALLRKWNITSGDSRHHIVSWPENPLTDAGNLITIS